MLSAHSFILFSVLFSGSILVTGKKGLENSSVLVDLESGLLLMLFWYPFII